MNRWSAIASKDASVIPKSASTTAGNRISTSPCLRGGTAPVRYIRPYNLFSPNGRLDRDGRETANSRSSFRQVAGANWVTALLIRNNRRRRRRNMIRSGFLKLGYRSSRAEASSGSCRCSRVHCAAEPIAGGLAVRQTSSLRQCEVFNAAHGEKCGCRR